jgi:hypothetical protein
MLLCIGHDHQLYLLPSNANHHWVEYETVKPLKPVVKVGQPLEFVSIKDTHRGCDLTFNDILYCKNGSPETYRYYASQDSGHINCMSEAGQALQWRFRHRVTEPTECYLQSNITLHLPWGIKKHQTLRAIFLGWCHEQQSQDSAGNRDWFHIYHWKCCGL